MLLVQLWKMDSLAILTKFGNNMKACLKSIILHKRLIKIHSSIISGNRFFSHST